MDILTRQLNSFTFEDIVVFVGEKIPEGVQLDYKKDFPEKGLAKIIASFANTRGGVIIIGVEEDEKTGLPIACEGILPDKHEDRVYQYIGNINPIPKVEIQTIDSTQGKVFVLIRVFEGDETPYYVHNDNNIWIRTGNVSKSVDIISPEGIDLLYKKRERAEIWRDKNCEMANNNYQIFLKNAEKERIKEIEIEKENYDIKKRQHEDGESMEPFKSRILQKPIKDVISVLKIVIQPFFQQVGFVRPLNIEPIILESRSQNIIYDFPANVEFKSINEGMLSFDWNKNDGRVMCQQIFSNGLVFSAHDILHHDNNGPGIHLGRIAGELYIVFSSMKKILQKFGYQGSIVGEISIDSIDDVTVTPVIETMWLGEIKKSVFGHMHWPIKLDTQILSDNEKTCNYINEIVRDIHWGFGFKDIQKQIKPENLVVKGYFREN